MHCSVGHLSSLLLRALNLLFGARNENSARIVKLVDPVPFK